jgi:hypothetical protein
MVSGMTLRLLEEQPNNESSPGAEILKVQGLEGGSGQDSSARFAQRLILEA